MSAEFLPPQTADPSTPRPARLRKSVGESLSGRSAQDDN